MELDLAWIKKSFSHAKRIALVSLLRTLFLFCIGFLIVSLFATTTGLILKGMGLDYGTQVFSKLLQVYTCSSNVCQLQFPDIIFIVIVSFIGIGFCAVAGSALTATLTTIITALMPDISATKLASGGSGIASVIFWFIAGVLALLLIAFASFLAAIAMIIFVFAISVFCASLMNYLGLRTTKLATLSTILCLFSAVYSLIVWTMIGLPLIVSIIPSVPLVLASVLIAMHYPLVILELGGLKKKEVPPIECEFCGKVIPADTIVCGFCGNLINAICKKCGERFKGSLNFCPKCGTENQDKKTYCTLCGRLVTGSDDACKNCEEELEQKPTKPILISARSDKTREKKEKVKPRVEIERKFCEKCGNELDGNFCGICGSGTKH